jgi:hypothetical protein
MIKFRKNLTRRVVTLSAILVPMMLLIFIVQNLPARVVVAAQQTDRTTSAYWAEMNEFVNFSHLASNLINTEAVTTYVYFPLVMKPLATPTLLSISLPTSTDANVTSQATASWTAVTDAVSYEIQESASIDFENATTYDAGTATSYEFSHNSFWDNRYYYRVRALGSVNSAWSNVLEQTYIYMDGFLNTTSGWAMRRQDTDDVDNEAYYEDGKYKMKIHGRWDSMIAGPLTPIPATWDSYRIDTRVILEDGVDNLHSYGIVFGGDWNGSSPCPNANFTTCYNHFYRINVIWFGGPGKLRVNLKRIDYHDYNTDKDVGVTLFPYADVPVSNPEGWNNWKVEVHADGHIRVFLNGTLLTDVVDTTYVGSGTYFGGFASSDEYLGTAAWFEYFRVLPLP